MENEGKERDEVRLGLGFKVLAMEGGAGVAAESTKTLQELAIDGQQHLETVVEVAHHILLTLNQVLCSPSFWVAPSSQPAPPSAVTAAGEAAGVGSAVTVVGDGGAVGRERGVEVEAELAALDATRLRYKVATAALRATVAAIAKAPQVGPPLEV